MNLPEIIYLQTITACNGHCRYCPFDDIYGDTEARVMSREMYQHIIDWLADNDYRGRIGFLLHCEPALDFSLSWRLDYAREKLPHCRLEVATNGTIDNPAIRLFDVVDCVKPGSRKQATSRAGNVRECPEIMGRSKLAAHPCRVPVQTMPISVDGEVLLCCQDWRHEAVVGTVEDLTAAREAQLFYAAKAQKLELRICKDCMAGKTAEEVGRKLGKRKL